MSQIPCPQCGSKDWSVVNLCLSCAKKTDQPMTLQIHSCPAAAAAEPEEAFRKKILELPACPDCVKEFYAVSGQSGEVSAFQAVEHSHCPKCLGILIAFLSGRKPSDSGAPASGGDPGTISTLKLLILMSRCIQELIFSVRRGHGMGTQNVSELPLMAAEVFALASLEAAAGLKPAG